MPKFIDLTGHKNGLLEVLQISHKNKHGKYMWKCLCHGCGKVWCMPGKQIRNSKYPAKGCRSCANKKHGMHNTPTYISWNDMKSRCKYDYPVNRHHYGKGITYDPAWESFENFYKDMGVRPEGYQLDRIDSSKGYCKDNCRWVTPAENVRNSSTAKLKKDDVLNIRALYKQGVYQKDIGKMFGICQAHVSTICRRKAWREI